MNRLRYFYTDIFISCFYFLNKFRTLKCLLWGLSLFFFFPNVTFLFFCVYSVCLYTSPFFFSFRWIDQSCPASRKAIGVWTGLRAFGDFLLGLGSQPKNQGNGADPELGDGYTTAASHHPILNNKETKTTPYLFSCTTKTGLLLIHPECFGLALFILFHVCRHLKSLIA